MRTTSSSELMIAVLVAAMAVAGCTSSGGDKTMKSDGMMKKDGMMEKK